MAPDSPLVQQLNPHQREAVLHNGTALLILAGAGSGKTRVITHRIAYLIEELGIHPMQILAVTFTNKAAGEMRERVEQLLGRNCRGLWVSTFHSACARILREQIGSLGYERNFVIYDSQDQKSLIRLCMDEINISQKVYSPDALHGRISQAKNDLVGPNDYAASAQQFGVEAKTAQVYERYQQRLRENNALDFDDLLFLTVRLFQTVPETAALYQERFRHILVDEYQDTNHAQYRLIRLLAAKHDNICVVGDDDQGIYSWRGADIGNILSFRDDYPDLKVIRLEQNYRSTQTILDAAWHVVERNIHREPKKLWTRNGRGSPVEYRALRDEVQEADHVCRTLLQLTRQGKKLSGMAVFYRTNAQSRVLEEALRRADVPFRVVGGFRFYERKEVRDLLGYLRVLANPQDGVSLRRILNVPARGIGATTLGRIAEYALAEDTSLFDAMGKILGTDLLPSRSRRTLGAFFELLKGLMGKKSELSPSTLLEQIDDKIGYTRKLRDSHDPTDRSREENVQELFSALKEFEERSEDKSLEAFLEEVSLITDTDQIDASQGAVTLMTLHSAKGLEFPVVFITGMEEGIFPHGNSLRSESGLEEERRLCYVGMTRAMERLFLTSAESRRIYGSYRTCIASRFIDEIPEDLMERALPPARHGVTHRKATREFRGLNQSPGPFAVQSRVHHPLWGTGTITASVPTEKGAKVTVRFHKGGVKKLIAELAGLRPL
jgi:DNA helicase-2/ATP-dependent DNA helicase PcrA